MESLLEDILWPLPLFVFSIFLFLLITNIRQNWRTKGLWRSFRFCYNKYNSAAVFLFISLFILYLGAFKIANRYRMSAVWGTFLFFALAFFEVLAKKFELKKKYKCTYVMVILSLCLMFVGLHFEAEVNNQLMKNLNQLIGHLFFLFLFLSLYFYIIVKVNKDSTIKTLYGLFIVITSLMLLIGYLCTQELSPPWFSKYELVSDWLIPVNRLWIWAILGSVISGLILGAWRIFFLIWRKIVEGYYWITIQDKVSISILNPSSNKKPTIFQLYLFYLTTFTMCSLWLIGLFSIYYLPQLSHQVRQGKIVPICIHLSANLIGGKGYLLVCFLFGMIIYFFLLLERVGIIVHGSMIKMHKIGFFWAMLAIITFLFGLKHLTNMETVGYMMAAISSIWFPWFAGFALGFTVIDDFAVQYVRQNFK